MTGETVGKNPRQTLDAVLGDGSVTPTVDPVWQHEAAPEVDLLPSSSTAVIAKPRVRRSDLICRVRRYGGVPPPDLCAQDSCACPPGLPVVRDTVVASMLRTTSSLRVSLARQLLLLAPRLNMV